MQSQDNRDRLLELRAMASEAHALFECIAQGRRRMERLKTDQGLIETVQMDVRKLVRQRLQLVRRQAQAEQAIAALKNPNLRALMRMRYLLGMSWAQIGAEMNYSRSQIFRMHQVALERIRFEGECGDTPGTLGAARGRSGRCPEPHSRDNVP